MRTPINHLNDFFYSKPGYANDVLTRDKLRETLLATGGWISAGGHMWDIKSKHIGAGIYAVTLKKRT